MGLTELWIEGFPFCDKNCPRCFANSITNLTGAENWLTWSVYDRCLREAASLGVRRLGIPGAGEPFLPGVNRPLTLKLIRLAAELSMVITVFSTGEHIDEALADELLALPVNLWIKLDSLDPDRQDCFVSNLEQGVLAGYGERRNSVLAMLTDKGFAQLGRLGGVTSIMEGDGLSNLDELPNLLRWCRRHNVHPDFDGGSAPVGRGETCGLWANPDRVRAVFEEWQRIDQEEFGIAWSINPTYIGDEPCRRYLNHLYVTYTGDVIPCLGARQVILGNVRITTLAEAWQRRERQIIAARQYAGKCTECTAFGKTCFSCLGRFTEDLNNASLLHDGCVHTIGCWCFKPKGGDE